MEYYLTMLLQLLAGDQLGTQRASRAMILSITRHSCAYASCHTVLHAVNTIDVSFNQRSITGIPE